MQDKKKTFIFALALLGTLLLLFSLKFYNDQVLNPPQIPQNVSKTQQNTPSVDSGKQNLNQLVLEDFEGLQFIDGTSFKAEDYKNKRLVVNFWASWCHNCRDEMPELQNFYNNTKEQEDVAFISVNLTDGKMETEETAKAYLKKHQFSMPTILDKEGQLFKKLGLKVVPITAILDKNGQAVPLMEYNGRIFYFHVGGINEKTILEYLNLLTEEGKNS